MSLISQCLLNLSWAFLDIAVMKLGCFEGSAGTKNFDWRNQYLAKLSSLPGVTVDKRPTLLASGILAPKALAAVPATSDACSETSRKNSFVSSTALPEVALYRKRRKVSSLAHDSLWTHKWLQEMRGAIPRACLW